MALSIDTSPEHEKDRSLDSVKIVDSPTVDPEKTSANAELVDDEQAHIIEKPEDVAIEVLSIQDDPDLPVFTFRSVFLGIGLSAFGSVLSTIYTFKPQNATVSQLFCLIISYVLGEAMAAVIPTRGWFRYLNPGPFNIKEHTAIVIMSSTASTVAVAMEIVAALDLYYNIRLNPAVAIFQIFATQMIGYGIAGLLRTLLVYPTYAFYPTYISVVNLLQSLHFGGLLNQKKRKYFWIVFAAIFFWEWIPQYPFPLLTAISIICMVDNGNSRNSGLIRNLFGAGSSNEGIGLLSFSTSWTLITQGYPLVWPLRTQINSFIGMGLGYIILTVCYYRNVFDGRDVVFMSTSLFGLDGQVYNQSAVLDSQNRLDRSKLDQVGLPRFTTTYALSQLFYNLSLGSAVVSVTLWYWDDLKRAFGSLRFLRGDGGGYDDPHYNEMKKYPEVPQWAYLAVFFVSLGVGIGCSYTTSPPMMPWWSIILFTAISAFLAIFLGFITATTGFNIVIRYTIQLLAAFIHPGNPIANMYANLYGNSTSFQTLYMLQDLKLGQYTKLPPRWTFFFQIAGSIVGSIFNYTMMRTIVSNNREILLDPVGSRIWSGWIIQQYNSAAVAMGVFGYDLFTFNKRYWLLPFSIFIGFFFPIPFWVVYKFSKKSSDIARLMQYLDLPIILLYIGYLPYSVNGQWWSCVVIGFSSQLWARTRRPGWFKKYNYLTSAALDGGSQVILFILSFAVFGASNKAISFPTWWGNPADKSVDRCALTA